jgi:hypothetical protein
MLDPENEVDVKNGSTILGSFSNLPGPSYFNIHAGGADAITKFVLSDAPLEDCCFEADNCSAIPINTVPAPIVSAGLLGIITVFGDGALLGWWRRRRGQVLTLLPKSPRETA